MGDFQNSCISTINMDVFPLPSTIHTCRNCGVKIPMYHTNLASMIRKGMRDLREIVGYNMKENMHCAVIHPGGLLPNKKPVQALSF